MYNLDKYLHDILDRQEICRLRRALNDGLPLIFCGQGKGKRELKNYLTEAGYSQPIYIFYGDEQSYTPTGKHLIHFSKILNDRDIAEALANIAKNIDPSDLEQFLKGDNAQ